MYAFHDVRIASEHRTPRWNPMIVIPNFSFALMIGAITERLTHWFPGVLFIAFGTIVMCSINTCSYWISEDSGTRGRDGRRPWRQLLHHTPCVTAVAASSGIGAVFGAALMHSTMTTGGGDAFSRSLFIGPWLASVAILLRPTFPKNSHQ